MAELFTFRGPWKGVDLSMPENMIDAASATQVDNFVLRAGEIRTSPAHKILTSGIGAQGEYIFGMATFVDSNNLFHTVAVTNNALYQLNPSRSGRTTQAWNLIGTLPTTGQLVPAALQIFVDKIFFTNGTANLYSWDGLSNQINIEAAGYGGYFLGELDAHLILLNTVESASALPFPQRVRWSPSGVTTTFDPAINVGAGFNDMLDTPDAITNFITVGRVGFITRTNGITEMTPTGKGTAPFDFNHLWASERGVGNVYPYACASYGNMGIIVSSEQVYSLSMTSFDPLGGLARNGIFVDLVNATSTIIGSILPKWSVDYPYPVYKLLVPQYPDTIEWNYAIEDKHWFRRILKGYTPSAAPKYIYTL